MKLFHILAMFLLSAAVIFPAAASIAVHAAHGFPTVAPAASWLRIDTPDSATYLLLVASIALLGVAGRAQQRAAQL